MAFRLKDSTFSLSEISIGKCKNNKSFLPIFFSLNGYRVIIRKSITPRNGTSQIPLSARTSASSGNSNARNRFHRLVLTPIYGKRSLLGPNFPKKRPRRKRQRRSHKKDHYSPRSKPVRVPSPAVRPYDGPVHRRI